LKSQNTTSLSHFEQQTNENLLNVSNVTADTTKQVKERRGWKKTFATWGILSVCMITFCVVFIIIRTIPKRKNAYLFVCKERDDSSNRKLWFRFTKSKRNDNVVRDENGMRY